ncbi:hypothetical protein MTO96_006675 [Rhipicephalus appendiculatus]
MLNDEDKDQQLIKVSLFAHAELLSGSEDSTLLRAMPQQKPIDRSMLGVGNDVNERKEKGLLENRLHQPTEEMVWKMPGTLEEKRWRPVI